MNAIRFHAVIGQEPVIRLPEGVHIAPGAVEVIVLSMPTPAVAENGEPTKHIFERLADFAKQCDTSDLPSDLAENHDHYLHGLPKGIDKE